MPAENGEGSPNPDKNRSEINRIKGLIKADNLIFRGHDYDNPGENELDGKEEELIKSFGLEKVETVQQLFDSMNDPNRGHEIPKEKLEILVTAFYESIEESGRKEIIIAGSFSIEKQLSWARFSGRDKSNEENQSFAFMIAEKFRSNFGTEEKRNEITTTMEYLDFIKNSEYGKNGGLEEAAGQAYDNLKKIKPNILNRKEMEAYTEVLKYVSGLRGEKKDLSGNGELVKEIKKLNEKIESLNKPREQKALDYDNLNLNELNMRGLETPESPENQLKLARAILDYIIFKHIYSYDHISSEIDFLRKLQSDKSCEENVRVEIEHVLALNDMYMSASVGDGRMGESIGRDRESSIDYIADTLGEDGGITKDFIEFLFKKGKYETVGGKEYHEYKVSEAWDLLQEAGLEYREMVSLASKEYSKNFHGKDFTDVSIIIGGPFGHPKDEKEMEYNERFSHYGQVDGNWFWDGNPERKEIMKKYMIDRLAKENKISNELAEKSFRLALMTYYASGENQYLNEDFIGVADMGKMMKIGIMRKIDWPKGKKSGPITTLNAIESCGGSYFRILANKGRYGDSVIGQQQKLLAKDINPDNIDGKHGYYLWGTALNINKFRTAYACFMDRSFDLDKLVDPDSLASKLDAFAKLVDYVPNAFHNMSTNPDNAERKWENQMKAHSWYIAGQMENALRENSNFDLLGLQKMYYHLVAQKNIPIKEKREGREVVIEYSSFLTDESWDKIMTSLKVYEKMRVKGKLVKRFNEKG